MIDILNSVQLWLTTTGEWLMPILMTVLTVLNSCSPIISKFKFEGILTALNDVKELLKNLLEKDTGKDLIEELKAEVKEEISKLSDLKNASVSQTSQNVILGHMLSTIFQYSSLPPEVKEHLKALEANLEFGADGKYLEDLLNENKELKTRLESIQNNAAQISKEASVDAEDSKDQSHKKVYLQVV